MTIDCLESQENSSGIRKLHELAETAVDGGLARRAPALERELAKGEGRMPDAKRRDLLERPGQGLQPARAPQGADGADLLVRGAARADEVGVIGVGQAIGARLRVRDDGLLLEDERQVTRPRKRKRSGDRVHSLDVRGDVPPAVDQRQLDVLVRDRGGQETSALLLREPDLEVRAARTAQRPGAEKRAAQVGTAATAARDDAGGWPLERSKPRREDPRLVQNLERVIGARHVELVARRLRERPLGVGPDLALDLEPAQQAEAAARNS